MKQLRARTDFETARIQAFLRDAGTVLRGDTRPLLSFDEVRRAARLEGQSYTGLKDVPIADIRGSVGRPNDFDASFLPVKPQMRKRWAQLDEAMRRGEPVPPIEVYHLGNVYLSRMAITGCRLPATWAGKRSRLGSSRFEPARR